MSKSSNINTFCCHVETWITNPSAHVPTQNIKKTLNYTMRKTRCKIIITPYLNNDTSPGTQKLKY